MKTYYWENTTIRLSLLDRLALRWLNSRPGFRLWIWRNFSAEVYELLESIENDTRTIPEGLWKRICIATGRKVY